MSCPTETAVRRVARPSVSRSKSGISVLGPSRPVRKVWPGLVAFPSAVGTLLPLQQPKIDKPQGDIPFDLGVNDIIVGDGEEATKGRKVSVHYVGVAFSTGEEFDASWNRGEPFEFKLGKGQVIPGWDAGVRA